MSEVKRRKFRFDEDEPRNIPELLQSVSDERKYVIHVRDYEVVELGVAEKVSKEFIERAYVNIDDYARRSLTTKLVREIERLVEIERTDNIMPTGETMFTASLKIAVRKK